MCIGVENEKEDGGKTRGNINSGNSVSPPPLSDCPSSEIRIKATELLPRLLFYPDFGVFH